MEIKALVGLITVLLSFVSGMNLPFEQKVIEACMEEANVPDLASFKEILLDDTESFPEEKCLRKCLYTHIRVIKQNGEVDLTFVKEFYQNHQKQLTNAMIDACQKKAEQNRGDVCAFALAGVHCYLSKVKFGFGN